MKRVFLGGTCNNSTWREELIPLLTTGYFNPVVSDWIPECQAEEILQRAECDVVLYVLTPKMTGVYSVAEVVDDSHRRPHKTVLVVLMRDGDDTFTPHQQKSLTRTMALVEGNGVPTFLALEDAANFINTID